VPAQPRKKESTLPLQLLLQPLVSAELFVACNTCVLCRYGDNYSLKSHDRDTAFPNWDDQNQPNGNVACGGMVSGNFKQASFQTDEQTLEDTDNNPDFHEDSRLNFFENEPAVDFGCVL
jgi:hypothetical protein